MIASKLLVNTIKGVQDTTPRICKKVGSTLQAFADEPKKLMGSLDGLATSNSILVKKKFATQLVDENAELFVDSCKKTLSSDLSDITVDNTVFVHMTDFMPEDGKILCARTFGKIDDGSTLPRSTVHFTTNNISPTLMGDPEWAEKKIGIIVPSERFFNSSASLKMLGGVPDDFMFLGDVKIPSGSVVIKYNSEIPQGKLKISQFANMDGVKMVETSNPNMGETVPLIIKKMGYSTIPTDEYNAKKMDNWREFLNKFGLKVNMHQTSPWGKAEGMIEYINFLKLDNDSWSDSIDKNLYNKMKKTFGLFDELSQEKQDGVLIDYKSIFLKILEEVKEEVPLEKRSFDYDELAKIIRESKTPSSAMEKIKNNLKLHPNSQEGPEGFLKSVMIFERYMLGTKFEELRASKFI